MTTRILTISALKMFVRNRQALFFTLFMPFIFIGIFGLIGFDKPQTIDLGIVTSKPTAATSQYLAQLGKLEIFKIHNGSNTEEREQLKKGERALVMVVPDSLIPDGAGRPSTQKVVLLKNTAREQEAQTAITILTQIFDKTTLQVVKAPTLFDIHVESVNAKRVNYIDFLLPGIVAMSIMQMAVFSVAFVFTDYKEKGILKRLLATPMKPQQFVTAQVITRLIVAVFQAAILLTAGTLIFHSHVYGALWLVALIVILGGIMFLGLGFTISGLSKTVDAVPAIANIIVFPMLFLSGVFFPTSTMPDWLQSIVSYLPLQHLAHSMREVVANGATLGNVASDIYWMLGWSIVMIFLAILTFRFEERRV